MDTSGIVLGQVVKSKAGRDKDRIFAVVGFEDGQYLYIADGDLRKIDRPKKKKVKHLARTGTVLKGVAEKLESGKKVTNAELRRNLKDLGG
jgi:large subunit ribosomal protein L14e